MWFWVPAFAGTLERRETTKPGYVYLMASQRNGTLYLISASPVTSLREAHQHRNRMIDGFSKEHGCTLLVWYEAHDDIREARAREWRMKKWKRAWKLDLIEQANPQWKDLYETLF